MDEEYLKCLKQLDRIARPQIQSRMYDSEQDFLRWKIKAMAWSRVEDHQKVIQRYEKKYTNWEHFSEAVLAEATAEQQAEGLEWEAARRMLRGWNAFREIWPRIVSSGASCTYTPYTARMYDAKYEKYLEALDELARPLILSGLYSSEAEFLRDFLKYYFQCALEEEKQVALGFEMQHISWEKFNDALMDIATPYQEDESMEWEAARDRTKSLQKLLDELP
jgi:Zn-dependent M32 family carboxypeptidase